MLEILKKKIDEQRSNFNQQIQTLASEFKVTDEIRNTRLETCHSCDKLHKKIQICTLCGCYVPAKTFLKSSSCPLKKWIKIEVEFSTGEK